ncbi:MAG: sigma-54 dependent transcriptional regulator [Phycisphaerae bacterium]|nr:sigma-54 dependent transcriptional regulator [Phycisphaerae bacterium]
MSEACHILVIDDEESICFAFRRYFEARGHSVEVAASAREGLARYRERRAEIVFLDVRLPDGSGLEVLEELRREDPAAVVVVMTAYGTLETVTRAIRGKAFDYIVKPLDLDRAAEIVGQSLASRAASGKTVQTLPAGGERGAVLIGSSAAMQDVYKRIGKVAQSDAAVLIRGETGTGKELVARAIHEHSNRAGNAFVAVNCGALPDNLVESELFGYVRGAFTGADSDKPGRFELADGGTLFLDEIGELPLAAQVKLLRFLDEHIVERLGSVRSIRLDVRILAATNRDLGRAIAQGQFRADLFYRLAVIQIALPSLSLRSDDILPLAAHFLALRSAPAAPPPITPQAAELLHDYAWPGNVRELRNAIDHASIVSAGGPILPAHPPDSVRLAAPAGDPAEPFARYLDAIIAHAAQADGHVYDAAIELLERALIDHALRETDGNQTAAAAWLGLHRNTLRNKLRDLGLPSDAQ